MVREDFYYPLFSERFKKTMVSINDKKPNYCVDVISYIDFIYTHDITVKHREVRSVKGIKMLDYRQKDGEYGISYLAIGKHPEFSDTGKWARKNRQEGKIGRVILNFMRAFQPILGFRLPTAPEVEDFVNSFKMVLGYSTFSFKLVSGDDIKKYYSIRNYAETQNGGYTLWGSCMRHDQCQSYFDIYTNNESCEMLLMFDESISKEKIVARALVWNVNGIKYIDRRYYAVDVYERSLINFVREQKWAYKAVNTYDDTHNCHFYVFNKEIGNYEERYDVKLLVDVPSVEQYPYVDTLKFINFNNGTIANYIHGECYRMNYTGGDYDHAEIYQYEHTYTCAICGREHDQIETRRMRINDNHNGDVCSHCYVYTVDIGLQFRTDAVEAYDKTGIKYFSKERISRTCILVDGKYYINRDNSRDSLIVPIETLDGEMDENVVYKKINNEYAVLLQ